MFLSPRFDHITYIFRIVDAKTFSFQAREVINGVASSDEDTSAEADVSITIRDVNDEPPRFNKQEYHVKIPENLPLGSPLPNLDMIVTDTDIVNIQFFSLFFYNRMCES